MSGPCSPPSSIAPLHSLCPVFHLPSHVDNAIHSQTPSHILSFMLLGVPKLPVSGKNDPLCPSENLVTSSRHEALRHTDASGETTLHHIQTAHKVAT